MGESNNKKQIFKTHAFFIEDKNEKKMHLLSIKNKMHDVFMRIAAEENIRVAKENRRLEQLEERRAYRVAKKAAREAKKEGICFEDFYKSAREFGITLEIAEKIWTKSSKINDDN